MRQTCLRCQRPEAGCYCAHVTPIATKTRLVLLQHPRERYVAIGTAHMASLCLTNSELHRGVDWSRSAELARALADSTRTPILLYPGEGARDIVREPPAGPVTLVVIDGTWSQTKKVLRENPILAALPRYAFVPPTPSEYRIRKEPDAESVATIEALVHALSALEEGNFDALLRPFRAMIDFQIACEAKFHGARVRHARHRARPRRMGVPRALSEAMRGESLVCIAAEANAWPYAQRQGADELVHFAAFRPATGETISFVVSPRGELAPGTVGHTGIDEATLRGGRSLEELHAVWRAFVRDDDVVCSWGAYELALFRDGGAWLPETLIDLRRVARAVGRGSAGTLGEYRDRVAGDAVEADGPLAAIPGRAGRKIRAIRDVVDHFGAVVRAAERETEA